MIDTFRGKYRFLSNFYPVKVSLDGEEYDSVEHAYQAAKTFNAEIRERFRSGISPGEAKQLAREFTLRDDWKKKKLFIMKDLLFQKFSQPELKEKLLATSPEELIEGNTWGDTFWGMCNGKGENHLGKLLMEIRDYLAEK